MSLRIRRGTEAQRTGLGYTFDPGELVYTTDSKKLYIGDGVTTGGQHVLATSAGAGLYWNPTTQQLDISGANLTTAYVQEDPTNLYYTPERAQDAASILFTHGDGHSGISFIYDDVNNKIYATVTGGGSGSALPGNATGYLHNDGAGTLSWSTSPLTTVSQDTSPHLGGNLTLNNHNITGNGSINITGNIASTNIETSTITISDKIISPGYSELVFQGNVNDMPGVQFAFSVVSADSQTLGTNQILQQEGDFRKVEIRSYSNSLTTPGDIGSGDILGTLAFTGIIHSTSTDIQSYIGMQVDPIGTATTSHLPTKFFIITQPAVESGWKNLLTFDCNGKLGINVETPEADLDVNGLMKLKKLSSAPASVVEGMIAVADGVLWNPCSKVGNKSYPVYYNGTEWMAFY